MEEAQSGGLIDKYWMLNWIIIPIIIILSIYGILTLFKCPYTEDVSSCFPYNMPKWFAIVPVIGLPILLLIIIKLYTLSK